MGEIEGENSRIAQRRGGLSLNVGENELGVFMWVVLGGGEDGSEEGEEVVSARR